jgi:outer membrane protein TolC
MIVASTALLVVTGALAQQDSSAGARIRSTMQSAVERGPGAAMVEARIDATRAGYSAATAPGAPTIELQREGFKGLFKSQLNSIWYLRARTPFNAPWQSSRNSALEDQVDEWGGPERRARALERAEEAAARWLELAAERERLDLLAERVARMDRALEIQQRRFDVGEVSGSEVTQLGLERLVDLAQLREAEARTIALASAIRALIGGDFPEPQRGDLATLIGASSSLPDPGQIESAVAMTAAVRAAQARASAESRWGDLLAATTYGRPEFSLEYERVPELLGLPAINAWGFMISVPLPFGRARSQRVLEARSTARLREAEARALQLDLERQLREALAMADSAAEVLVDLRPSIARASEIERSLADQFRLGAISYLVYIDGLTRLDEVLLQATASRLSLLSARLRAAALLDDPTIFPLPAPMPQAQESLP